MAKAIESPIFKKGKKCCIAMTNYTNTYAFRNITTTQ